MYYNENKKIIMRIQKHAIITPGRTGSNLLCAVLNMHPECINRGEIFGDIRNIVLNEYSWQRPDLMVDNFWFKDYSKMDSVGFKCLYFHDTKRDCKVSDFLIKHDYKVIHLKRRNKLKQYISWKKVLQGDKWGDDFLFKKDTNPWLNGKVEVDIPDLIERFEVQKNQEKVYTDKFPNALEVYYEDIVSDFDLNFTKDNNKTIQDIFNYLGLDYQRIIDDKKDVNSFLKETDLFSLEEFDITNHTSTIRKKWLDIVDGIESHDFFLQKSRILPLNECILNYDEVREKLVGTAYEIYLDEKYSLNDYKHRLLKIIESNGIDIEILKENEVYLLGGSILRLFMDLPLDTDLDLYFLDFERFTNVNDYFNENFSLVYDSPLFVNYQGKNLIISLIYNERLLGDYEYVTKTHYDFSISAGCFDFKTETFNFGDNYFNDLKNRKLVPYGDRGLWRQNSPSVLKRVDKFKKLGFTIDEDVENILKENSRGLKRSDLDEYYQRFGKKSWLRDEDVYPVVPNIDIFVNWLMDIKEHEYFDKFNYYIFGGFISWPEKTKDIDLLITKRDGQHATLKELEKLMVDMFDSAYDTHGFFLDTCYMRIPQWIADYPRDEERLRSVEKTGLWITITKNKPEYPIKFRRYGKLNCCYRPSFTNWYDNDSDMINRWVNLDANYARMVDLRRIIKYYENNKERNMEDFLNEFQEYSGY